MLKTTMGKTTVAHNLFRGLGEAMATWRSSFARVTSCLLLFLESLHAFSIGSGTAAIDLDTTLPLSVASFWGLACSENFYRDTRKHSRNVHQKVLDLTKWTPPHDASTTETLRASPSSRPLPATVLPSQPQLEHIQQEQQQREQQQQQQQEQQRRLHREARLVCAISTPFGSSNTAVVQEHKLESLQEGQELGGKMVQYSETNRIEGFPMMPGGLFVETNFAVCPVECDPGSIRVLVSVTVGKLKFPRALRWIEEKVSNIIRADGKKQATRWLEKMAQEARP